MKKKKSIFATLTGENGLVDTQGRRLDGDDPDVSWHFVTNWYPSKKRKKIMLATGKYF